MKQVLILGSTEINVGDGAVPTVSLKKLLGDTDIIINAASDAALPSAIRAWAKTIPTNATKGLAGVVKAILHSDAIIYGGGDLWVELYGDRFPRQALYKMAFLNMLARLLGKRVYYIGCGVGKLSGYSLWLARLSAKLAHAIITRDAASEALLDLPTVTVLPDIAINLPAFDDLSNGGTRGLNAPAKAKTGTKKTIAIAPLYHVPDPAACIRRCSRPWPGSCSRCHHIISNSSCCRCCGPKTTV